jgi:hybrid cluster-associated redox disulfide protein
MGGKMVVKKQNNKTSKIQKKEIKKPIKNEKKITRKTLIGDAVREHPKVAAIMFEYGLHCIGCVVSTMETIEQGCSAHGLSDKQIDEMVKKINNSIK